MADLTDKSLGVNADPVKSLDKGVYADAVEKIPEDQKLANTAAMPKAPDPSPFKLGPMAAGDRK